MLSNKAVYYPAGRWVLHFHSFRFVFELVNAMGCLFQRAKNYLCTCDSLGVYYYNYSMYMTVLHMVGCLSNE